MLKDDLIYDPETGKFFWKRRKQGWKKGQNKEAGARKKDGYVSITHEGWKYSGHRLAWFMYYGKWPERDRVINHINGMRDDNRIVNLEEISHSSNIYHAWRIPR